MRSSGYIVVRIAIAAVAAACALALTACGNASVARSGSSGDTAAAAAAAANAIAVSPLPGTPDASAVTQVSFLGGAGTRVAGVEIRGSASGAHSGRLLRYSTGTGESFVPERPFAPGERVTVSARIVAGPSRGRLVRSWFTVAVQAPVAEKEWGRGEGDPRAVQHYISAPSLTPSTVRLTTPAQTGAAPGDLMLTPYRGRGTPGPMIVDQAGGLIWFDPLPANESASNLGVQDWEGHPALVWWQGRVLELGFGQGEDVIADEHYRTIATIRAGNGYSADLHVVRLTPQGTAWIDAFDIVRANLSAAGGGARAVLSDPVVQEIDVRTGLVMWEWHGDGHIPLGESFNPIPSGSYPWDFAHVNSVDPGSHADVLVSVRNTWSIDDIDIRTGRIVWRLGGRHSSFHLQPSARFYWQHDAEFQPGGRISLFDNGSNPPKERQSRGLVFTLDAAAHSARVVAQYANPHRTLLASSQGSAESLPGGGWLLGYGELPDFTEYNPHGGVVLDGTLGRAVQSFRAGLASWQGLPVTSPSVALVPTGRAVAVSWNGATDVARWELLAGADPGHLRPAGTVARSGFETVLALPASLHGGRVAVEALDSAGAVLGVSATIAG